MFNVKFHTKVWGECEWFGAAICCTTATGATRHCKPCVILVHVKSILVFGSVHELVRAITDAKVSDVDNDKC
jgi:hypothetical protein